MFHTEFVREFITYLHTKFLMLNSNNILVTIMNSRAKYRFLSAFMIVLHSTKICLTRAAHNFRMLCYYAIVVLVSLPPCKLAWPTYLHYQSLLAMRHGLCMFHLAKCHYHTSIPLTPVLKSSSWQPHSMGIFISYSYMIKANGRKLKITKVGWYS
jgi:hypothetical protein